MISAVACGDLFSASRLLSHGADVNATDEEVRQTNLLQQLHQSLDGTMHEEIGRVVHAMALLALVMTAFSGEPIL